MPLAKSQIYILICILSVASLALNRQLVILQLFRIMKNSGLSMPASTVTLLKLLRLQRINSLARKIQINCNVVPVTV